MQKPLLPLNLSQFEDSLNLDAVKKFLTDNKDNEDVKTYLGELSAATSDKVKAFLDTVEGRQLIKPTVDQAISRAIETWKDNNLSGLVDDEVKKRNPDKTPEQLEIEKIRKELEDAKNASKREALINKALKLAEEKGLPRDLVEFFVGADEDSTTANLAVLEEKYNAAVTKQVDEKFKDSGRVVPKGSDNSKAGGGGIDVNKLASEANITNL